MVDFTFTFTVGSLNTLQVKVKGKEADILRGKWRGEVIISHLKAVRWHQYCLKHRASVMPDLWLSSQLHSITALWLVSNYTAWRQARVAV